ncbi:anthranilate synthase component I family protein [Luteolibacter algae]|uniref:Anthranilate synthase component I family protein n=2 Tax=Luteolibacter algae TaxID=454151 RepID=A0ABW5DB30_9BACT
MTERGMRRVAELAGMEAVEVVRRLEWLGNPVFFDTAGNVPQNAGRAISVVSAAPAEIFRGSIFSESDRKVLDAVLAGNASVGGDLGLPAGGLCGWVSYEGDYVFGEYREMLVRDEESGDWWELGGLSQKLGDPLPGGARLGEFSGEMSRERFLDSVRKVKDWIAAGDIYQVNVAQAFSAEVFGEGSLFGLYEVLRDASPAPMGVWMSLDGIEVLGTSPELFLKISGKGVETRPIKGTRPRFSDLDEDLRSAVELQTSPKEVAELVMITDLLRNDIGQVCEFGSVEVSEMLRLESLAQVHHLVSTVKGRLRAESNALSALAACFPGGSITGAPKKRAMEIIAELEQSPRGIYCGAMGWLGFNGESQFNIAIRTMVRRDGILKYQVGAGIVADSIPEDEYRETLQKAEGLRLGVERWRAGNPGI